MAREVRGICEADSTAICILILGLFSFIVLKGCIAEHDAFYSAPRVEMHDATPKPRMERWLQAELEQYGGKA